MDKTIDHRLAWLAGIIDGEGWIGFRIQSHRRRNKTYKSADWYIAVGNTDAAMLVEMMAIGTILGVRASRTKYYLDNRRANQKPLGRVSWNSKRDCGVVLQALLPYLITKKPQAELLLRALAHHRTRTAGSTEDPVLVDIAERMSLMNRRGTASIREM